jgi:hypothetical protein
MVVDAPPGGGPRLHRHPYEEVFVVQEGTATFTAGDKTVEVKGGHAVVVPTGVPHKFVNSGTERLRQVDVHARETLVTEWLEDLPGHCRLSVPLSYELDGGRDRCTVGAPWKRSTTPRRTRTTPGPRPGVPPPPPRGAAPTTGR